MEIVELDSDQESLKEEVKPKASDEPEIINVPEDENVPPNGSRKRNAKESAMEKLKASPTPKKPKVEKAKGTKSVNARCKLCLQRENGPSILTYGGHPQGAINEMEAIFQDGLVIQNEEDANLGELPQLRCTNFSFYDEASHLVSLDGGMVERGKNLFLSGYVKPIYDDSPSCEGAVPIKDAGPVRQWWITGYDGGNNFVIGVTTPDVEYYLVRPSEEYSPLFIDLKMKSLLSKTIIDYLQREDIDHETISYEDVVNVVESVQPPEGMTVPTMEDLVKHADFVVDQINSYETAADEDENEEDYVPMMRAPCVEELLERSGIRKEQLVKKRGGSKVGSIERKERKVAFSKATTTPLVTELFEVFFSGQLAYKGKDGQIKRRKRCYVCDACVAPDCGRCTACQDMVKFGGSGKSKQACVNRKCENMTLVPEHVEEDEDIQIIEESKPQPKTVSTSRKKLKSAKVEWVDPPVKTQSELKRSYYEKVMINDELFQLGDFCLIHPENPDIEAQMLVGQIIDLLEENKLKQAHVHWYMFGNDTILGGTSSRNEMFPIERCENTLLSDVERKVMVKRWEYPENWSMIGGTEESLAQPPIEEGEFYWRLWYNPKSARFESHPDLPEYEKFDYPECPLNKKVQAEYDGTRPMIKNNVFMFRGQEYRVSDAVFLKPNSFKFDYKKTKSKMNGSTKKGEGDEEEDPEFKPKQGRKNGQKQKLSDIDEDTYPEYYRKTDSVKGSNEKTPDPFQIGIIVDMKQELNKVKLTVRKLYRPENTSLPLERVLAHDFNNLYWSDEHATVDAANVEGKCFVKADGKEWTSGGEYRFFFEKMFNAQSNEVEDLPIEAENFGTLEKKTKGKGKGKGSSSGSLSDSKKDDDQGEFPSVTRPLRTLDVFAGCGGLSLGLHQAGISKSEWAIENFEPAAKAYKANYPDCTVFSEDCNKLLAMAIEGKTHTAKGQRLPQRGEVELLVGGPPCQGFSGMNRHNAGEYSLFKNSLVSTYLSYIDYYRPKFFILENVRTFASHKKGLVLKLCLRALVKMGFQCAIGILQAGNFGVAQTRRRAILIAASPDMKLPLYPEPLHVFSKHTLTLQVDQRMYEYTTKWDDSAPYRTVTVRDTMSDLPPIASGAVKFEMPYLKEPESPFQSLMRGYKMVPGAVGDVRPVEVLRDHVTKSMTPLINARMALIPTNPGADWRDLPNIEMQLSDGTWCHQLIYAHHDVVQGRSSTGALRGVCICASQKRKCDPMDKQANTLIPWCLPHTSNRHNQWAGLYGRINWDGYFSTTVTNPEPMGKQGRVLHPEQHRLVSIRECARSQGFPDYFKFYGTVIEKHRQIGNAVPPPMGHAIGMQIRKAMAKSQEFAKE